MRKISLKNHKDIKILNSDQMGSSTNMNYDPSFKDVSMFGTHISTNKIEVDNASKISKLFTSKYTDFSLRDSATTFEKLVIYDCADVVNSVLKNHFGHGVLDYPIYVPVF